MQPIYKKKENFLNFYINIPKKNIEKNDNEIEFEDNVNILNLSDKELDIDRKILLNLFKLNLHNFLKFQKKEDDADSISIAIVWQYSIEQGIISFICSINYHFRYY